MQINYQRFYLVYHEHLNHLKLDNLDLNDKLAPLFEIPGPALRKAGLEQKVSNR